MQQRRDGGGRPVTEAVYELPLVAWRDVPGSKVRPWDFVRALFAVQEIRRRYRL